MKKPAKALPQPPDSLSGESQALWLAVVSGWALDRPGELVLLSACEALDRMRQCQATLKAEGLTTEDRFGQTRAHPLLAVERDSRNAVLKSLKQLGLKVEDLPPAGLSRGGRP
jgi:P27 family predicted phage terminase small subunit